MGERDVEQGESAVPAPVPLDAAGARVVTAGLREAMDDVRRSVGVLAARVRDAHAARVWAPLGHASWAKYCAGEFGISRAQAYRLLDVARALGTIQAAVADTDLSRMRDTDPAAAAVLDYGLSQHALIAVSARPSDIADLITNRLAALAHSAPQAPDPATVRAVVRQAVHDIRTTPPPAPDEPPTNPTPAALRRAVDDLAAHTQTIGELLLEVAPAYLSDHQATGILVAFCDDIGIDLDHGLAARRYALTSDRRALHGTVL
ncbi:hypothetical protein OIC43_45990 (plasmid) [Streptomyces sp. NBC_00825]|uniref:hypothetical protein n=2 Tax=Streptomyces TaxID=1883 RepID=UPI002259753C|nr:MULTISPECIES: hypothetical protein [unclassified Streptomyces]WTH95934.1 hypothetical protein OIC43_43680 [Streptomyces sp. NBC_00825]WTI05042.1 hypothetical protein OHA23_45965 [Streptomyces sp. NBC_00822]MCX4869724.1 hypothetical protein [Streptomyces sp. NBC_00906]MCX4870304.1 hypothetical protein [Streptomyces sp. NBC_00906]MCX4870725.1 hypothetical protein [Streptomyces sp. NBC_00906]